MIRLNRIIARLLFCCPHQILRKVQQRTKSSRHVEAASATWAHRRGGVGVLGYSRAKLARRSPLQLIEGTSYSTSPYSGEKTPTSACSDKWHEARDHALPADLYCMILFLDFLGYWERATLLHVNRGHLWEPPGSGRRYLAATAISASHNVA